MCVYILYLFFLGGMEGRIASSFSFFWKKKRSVLHIVPLFDGDVCGEIQGMIYDVASFNCERQNALLIREDLRWVIMEDGTGQFSSHRRVWSCADWLAPGRLCRCIAWVAHEFIHHHEAHYICTCKRVLRPHFFLESYVVETVCRQLSFTIGVMKFFFLGGFC